MIIVLSCLEYLNLTASSVNAVSVGLKDSLIVKRMENTKEKDCPICFEDMTKCKFPLKCGHWAHTECVTRWDDKCPICRKKYVLWDEHNTRSKRNNERELAKYGRLLEQITTEEAFATLISC